MPKHSVIEHNGSEVFRTVEFLLNPGDAVVVPTEMAKQLVSDFDFLSVVEGANGDTYLKEDHITLYEPFASFVFAEAPAKEDNKNKTETEPVVTDPENKGFVAGLIDSLKK
jgi:hypothetical protein